jgi:hypothetical protein
MITVTVRSVIATNKKRGSGQQQLTMSPFRSILHDEVASHNIRASHDDIEGVLKSLAFSIIDGGIAQLENRIGILGDVLGLRSDD